MLRDTVGTPSSEHSKDARGLLVGISLLDKCVQIVAKAAMRYRIMYFPHNNVDSGHPSSFGVYNTLSFSNHSLNMTADVQDYGTNCQSCLWT